MADQRLRKRERLSRRRDFDRVFQEGWRVSDRVLMVRAVENGLPYSRIGIIVSKKHGKAVRRNRIRRWIREAYRRNKGALPVGLDLVVIPRTGTELNYRVIESSLLRLGQDLERKRRAAQRKAGPDETQIES